MTPYKIRYCESVDPKKIWRWWITELHPAYMEDRNQEMHNYFQRLEESIAADGCKSPLILTKGGGDPKTIKHAINHNPDYDVLKRPIAEKMKSDKTVMRDQYFATETGDARIMTAIKLGITLPAFVLDFTGTLDDCPLIETPEQFLSYFDPVYRDTITDVSFNEYDISFEIDPFVKSYFSKYYEGFDE